MNGSLIDFFRAVHLIVRTFIAVGDPRSHMYS
uniref:Uncharacterized protein n=1 Tax=Anguilla anguilla TaxID=7936 RepID=A0A0E9VWX1_ANGAN